MKIGQELKNLLTKSNLYEAELLLILEDNPYWETDIEKIDLVDGGIQMKKGSRTNIISFSKFLSKIAKEEGTETVTNNIRYINDVIYFKHNTFRSDNKNFNKDVLKYLQKYNNILTPLQIKTVDLILIVFGHKSGGLGRACENFGTLTPKVNVSITEPMSWTDICDFSIEKEGYSLKIEKGSDIIKCYKDNKGGVTSCMTNAGKQLRFYTKQPNRIRLVCIKKDGIVKGRALLWHLDSGDIFLDRRYMDSKDKNVNEIFNDFVSNTNVIFRKNDGSYNFIRNNITYTAPLVLNLEIDFPILTVPYFDTFIIKGLNDEEGDYEDEDEDEEDENNQDIPVNNEVEEDFDDDDDDDDDDILKVKLQTQGHSNNHNDIYHSFYNDQISKDVLISSIKNRSNTRLRFLSLVLKKEPDLIDLVIKYANINLLTELMIFEPEYKKYVDQLKPENFGNVLQICHRYNDFSLFENLEKNFFQTKNMLNILTCNINNIDLGILTKYKCFSNAIKRLSNKGKMKLAIRHNSSWPISKKQTKDHLILWNNFISKLNNENLEEYYKTTRTKEIWDKIENKKFRDESKFEKDDTEEPDDVVSTNNPPIFLVQKNSIHSYDLVIDDLQKIFENEI